LLHVFEIFNTSVRDKNGQGQVTWKTHTMPFVRISMTQGRPRSQVRAIADGVHQALVDTFDVPPDDRFQAIHLHAADELICDPGYLGVNRSSDFMLIHITAGRPRSTDAKTATYRRIVELLADNPGVRPDDVMVVISFNEIADWSFGQGKAQLLESSTLPPQMP
jgi:phenylpyruvate tautomerase PptA (4-oxalocrotonate tautomerase family)